MILLLHGALGAAASMQALQERLRAQGADVHALDFSGHGQAAWPERGFSLEVFEEDVLRYMNENGINAAHLFGYSITLLNGKSVRSYGEVKKGQVLDTLLYEGSVQSEVKSTKKLLSDE